MSTLPPPWDPSDDADEQYRRASDLDPSRPSEATRRAVLSHAARVAAERSRRDTRRYRVSRLGAMLRWQPALVGTVATALLIGVLVAPQFLIPRAPENTAPAPVPDLSAGRQEAQAPALARSVRPAAPPAALQRARPPAENFQRTPTESAPVSAAPPVDVASLNEPRADMSRTRSEAALASNTRAVQAPRPPATEADAVRRAAAAGDLTALDARLAGSVDIDSRDEQGRTALMLAVVNGHKDAVELLLAHGADPNAADAHGTTPLQAAERNGSPSISSALRRYGAR